MMETRAPMSVMLITEGEYKDAFRVLWMKNENGSAIIEETVETDVTAILEQIETTKRSRPETAPVYAEQIRAKTDFTRWLELFMRKFTEEYPSQEIASWPTKLAAARRVIDGHDEPIIHIEASLLGIDPTTLAEKVISKGEMFERIVAATSAVRSKMHRRLQSVTTVEDVHQVEADARQEVINAAAQEVY